MKCKERQGRGIPKKYVPVAIERSEENQGVTTLYMGSSEFEIHPRFIFTNISRYDVYIWLLTDEVVIVKGGESKELTFSDVVAYNKGAVIRIGISNGVKVWSVAFSL